MEIVKIADIVVSGRARQEFSAEAIGELADSIQDEDIGLLHAIGVAKVNGEMVLVSGERRLQAISLLETFAEDYKFYGQRVPVGSIPVEYDEEPTVVARLKRELDENERREKFTWQEKTALTAHIAKLAQKKQSIDAGDKDAATSPTLPTFADLTPQAIKDTAERLHQSPDRNATQKVRQDLELASAMEDEALSERLGKAKTQKDASKLLKKIQQEAVSEQLATEVGKTFHADKHNIAFGDCVALLALEDEGSFELCITDPPYGINAHQFGDSGSRRDAQHSYDDSPEYWAELMPRFVLALDRVMKPNSHIYLACDVEKFGELKKIIHKAGLFWQIQRTPIIQRNKDGRVPIPDFTYRRNYECWLYCRKGKKQTNAIIGDVIDTNLAKSDSGHAAAKSRGIIDAFLTVSGTPGQKCIDPFAGSGGAMQPVHDASMFYTGFENNKISYGELIKTAKKVGMKNPDKGAK